MNIYLFPWHTDEVCTISKVVARSYEDCEEKIKSMYINKYDDLDDLLDYDDFCIELAEKHEIYLGDVSEINEFM
jgi:hypothetical protein